MASDSGPGLTGSGSAFGLGSERKVQEPQEGRQSRERQADLLVR